VFLFEQCHSPDVYNITFLADWHVYSQRNHPMFSKRPREHIADASPLCVGYFGKLLEDGGSGQKAKIIYS